MSDKFKLGDVYITPGAMKVNATEVQFCLSLHRQGMWGNLCEEDKKANDEAVKTGERILSSYITESGAKIWIITEYDRSVTTILTPEEY